MRGIDKLLFKYGESHQNAINKGIHWICVPAIMFSLIGLLFAIPFPWGRTLLFNWAAFFLLGALLYYFRLSMPMSIGFLLIALFLLWGNHAIFQSVDDRAGKLARISLVIFAVAWIGQFIGHRIEGKKPSFLEDIQFLLIGPAWLMHFVFKRMGVRY